MCFSKRAFCLDVDGDDDDNDDRHHGSQHRRSRRQRLKAKLYHLKEEQKVMGREIMAMQHQQLNDEEKLRHYRNELHALRAHQAEQQRQMQFLQEEVRKLRTLLPTVK